MSPGGERRSYSPGPPATALRRPTPLEKRKMRPVAIALTVLTSVGYLVKHPVTNRSLDAAGRQPPPLPTVSVGTEHGCGLSAGGRAYCWGSNRLGQLGDDH